MKKLPIFILSGPGGAGKTSVAQELFNKKNIKKCLVKGVTLTTRAKRPQENEGKDYFFSNQDEFLYLKKKKFFLESEKVLDDYYGTPALYLKIAKAKKKGLLLCLDVKGAMNLKRKQKNAKIITIFITTPKKKDLYQRMEQREEEKKKIKRRVELAKKELQFSKKYDYLVQNKDLDLTVKKVEEIILKKLQ